MKKVTWIIAVILSLFMVLSAISPISGALAEPSPRTSPPTLTNANVFPNTGDTTTNFSFTVMYTDSEGDMPLGVWLHIGTNIYPMAGNGTNATLGIPHFFGIQLPAGNHTYYYNTNNTASETARDPPTSGSYLLQVSPATGSNPQLLNHQVTPTNPVANQAINFTVTFQDPTNNPPDNVRLYIKLSNTTTSYSQYDMSIIGNSYSTGVTCYKSLLLNLGNYDYYLQATSGTNVATDPSSGLYYLSVSAGNPMLMGGSVTPPNGTANQTMFKYNVIYQDGNFGPPVTNKVYIDGTPYDMVEETGDTGSEGIYYTYSTTLDEGAHDYYFQFSDGTTQVRWPTTGTSSGPAVDAAPPPNNPPEVSVIANPSVGTTETTFYFNGTASDPDGDPLSFFWTFSDGYNASGLQYVTRVFTIPGSYSVTFTAKDPGELTGIDTTAVDVTQAQEVPENNPPVIVTNLDSLNHVEKDSTMHISALDSYDPENDPMTFYWTLTHSVEDYTKNYYLGEFDHTFDTLGEYVLTLEVSDGSLKKEQTFTIICEESSQLIAPVAHATAIVYGSVVALSGDGSYDPDGVITSYTWGMGTTTYYGKHYNHTFYTTGAKSATLTVTDDDGLEDSTIVHFNITTLSSDTDAPNDDMDQITTPIGSYVEVGRDTLNDAIDFGVIDSEEGFQVSLIESKINYLKFSVISDHPDGKLIIFDINDRVFDFELLNRLEIILDSIAIGSTDYDSIIKESGDAPLYHHQVTDDNCKVYLYIPAFSVHIVEITLQEVGPDEIPADETDTNLLKIVSIISVMVVIAILAAVFIQIRKKKKQEYFRDFHVAEDRTYNYGGVKSEQDGHDDWDNYL